MKSFDSYSTGAKKESQLNKGRYDLISPIGIRRLAQRYQLGAEKYEEHNEKKGLPLSRYFDSGLRHIFQYLEGDRSEDHLAAVTWNFLSAMHTEELINKGDLPKELQDLYA